MATTYYSTPTSSASSTWATWTSEALTASSSATSNDSIWSTWASDSSIANVTWDAAGSPSGTVVWHVWIDECDQVVHQEEIRRDDMYDAQRYMQQVPNRPAEEEIQAPRVRLREDYKERQKARVKAEKRAKELLLDLIGEEDLKVYNKTGRLYVPGKQYDYIIQKEGFIKRIEKDKITDICVHLGDRSRFPDTDNVVALKLALEDDEQAVLELANEHGSRKRPKKLPQAACMRRTG